MDHMQPYNRGMMEMYPGVKFLLPLYTGTVVNIRT
jgi:hypothetical protein